MSKLVEEILRELKDGTLEIRLSDTDYPIFPFGLPNIPCFIEDGANGFLNNYHQIYGLTCSVL